jgi:hypothetical protein
VPPDYLGELRPYRKRILFEKYRYLPVSGHKEALQVKLPGGLIAVPKLKGTAIPLSYSLAW